MNDVRPGSWLLLGGGGLLVISTFLDWFSAGPFSENGLNTDLNGFQGIFVLLIGVVLAALGAAKAFGSGSVSIPDSIGPIATDTLVLGLGLAAFLITFGLQFRDSAAIGITLGWIAAAAGTVGAFMESSAGASSGGSSQGF